jgi:hypothetical protein
LAEGNAITDTSLDKTDIVAWADRQVEELHRLFQAGETSPSEWSGLVAEIERGAVPAPGEAFPYEQDPSPLYQRVKDVPIPRQGRD